MSSVWEDNLKHFRNRLASAEPAPGGGSAAMVSAALGCGLLIMAAEIAALKEGARPELKDMRLELHELLEKLSRHADEDISAYETYVAARKLPRDSEEERASRSAALSAALAKAAEIPVVSMEDSLAALRIGLRLAPLVHTGILSDVGAGAALLKGALDASLFTLLSNVRLMPEGQEKEVAMTSYKNFSSEAEAITREIFSLSTGRLTETGNG